VPNQGKKPTESTDSDKQMEDDDFFDEISSKLDSLKNPPTDSKEADHGVEPALGPPDSESNKEAPVKKNPSTKTGFIKEVVRPKRRDIHREAREKGIRTETQTRSQKTGTGQVGC